jgi:hypothetical protein
MALAHADRDAAIAEIERISDTLSQLATWLGAQSEDQAAILLEDAWRDLNAAAHVLERRQRRYPQGWLSGQPYQLYGPQNGAQRYREYDGDSA